MNRRILLPAMLTGIVVSLATAGWAQTGPDPLGSNPPVFQEIGMLDTIIANQEAADCRVCHTGTVRLHHVLYGQYVCLDCHTQGGQGGFVVERDCTVCHTTSPHHTTDDAMERQCSACHGSIVSDYDDGHYIPTYAPSLVTPKRSWEPHTGDPLTGEGGLPLNSRNVGAGACNYCHDADTAPPDDPVLILDNHDTHHDINLGVDITITNPDSTTTLVRGAVSDGQGGVWRKCNLCHDYHDSNSMTPFPVTPESVHDDGKVKDRYPHLDPSDPARGTYRDTSGPGFELAIRICEECHSPVSLHNIQADSDANGIVVGGELAGYGHVGRDAGPGDSDCWGCHGFDFNASSVPFAGPTIPTLYNTDIASVPSGTASTVILTGASFANTTGGKSYEAQVRLTSSNGSTVTLKPELVLDEGSLAVQIPAKTRPGNYRIQAVKGEVASNPVTLSVTPVPRVTRATFQGTVTIIGSGLGGYAEGSPTGVTATIRTGIGRRASTKTVQGTIVSWTDSKIVVDFGAAPQDVTVTTVFGTVKAAVATK